MEQKPTALHSHKLFNDAFAAGMIVKAFDGLLEMIAGVWLWAAPISLHGLLAWLLVSTGDSSWYVVQMVSVYIARLDHDVIGGNISVLLFFLLSHGMVKVVLVYCLAKKMTHVYPYALIVLFGFFIVQMATFARHQTWPMIIFMLLDGFIIWLIYKRWRAMTVKMS